MKPVKFRKIIFLVLVTLIGFTALSFKSNLFEVAKQLEIFTAVYKELHMNYVDETNPAELMESAIKSMLRELDPYTVFLTEQDAEGFKIDQAGEYAGIGADVQFWNERLILQEIYEGLGADLAGLKAGDEILSVGGVSVKELRGDALTLLKGESGTSVVITFSRTGKVEQAAIARSAVDPDAVPFFGMADDQTGYIVLSRFNTNASKQVREAVLSLKASGAERLVLDVRGNPGGLLGEAINIVNLFIPKDELVVTTRSSIASFNQSYKTREEPIDASIPLAILIDENSASASEIVAGSLQDLDRAVILGTQSFGKGLVQRQLPLTYGTQLKVTISRYYTPSGRCIQAMDYQNRDDSGNATRKNEFNIFRTRNGRQVTDGGGISPDIYISSQESSDLLTALIEKKILFDFTTAYCQSHIISDISEFSFSEADYKSFIDFAAAKGFQFETDQELAIKKILAETPENLSDSEIRIAIKNLLLALDKEHQKIFDASSEKIKAELEKAIITRFFYRSGLYTYLLEKDETIIASRELLKDLSRYNALLN
jgi:carboxyl-terminal processing protease